MQNAIALNPIVSFRVLSLKVSFRKFWVVSVILIASFLIFYVYQMNNLVSRSYSIKTLQNSVNSLTQENEDLQARLAGAVSLQNVENLIAGQQFEEISQIQYVQIPDNTVVIAK